MDTKKDAIVKSISAGGHHTLFLTDKGHVFACGSSNHGQLGLKSKKNRFVPTLVFSLTNKLISKIAAGWRHSIVLTDSHDVYTTGLNQFGQLYHKINFLED